MIVIIPGDLNRLEDRRAFECPVCGCVFEASKREYVPEYSKTDIDYRAVCPCCGKAVYHGRLLRGREADPNAAVD